MFMSKKFKNLKLVTIIKKIALYKEITQTGTSEQRQNRKGLEILYFRCKKTSAECFQKVFKYYMCLFCICMVIPPSLIELEKFEQCSRAHGVILGTVLCRAKS